MLDQGRVLSFHVPTPIRLGPGVVEMLTDLSPAYGRHALVVTGRSAARQTGLLGRVLGLLGSAGVRAVVFDRALPNPLSTTVDEGAELARQAGVEFVIGLGGGSAMDTAKMIALVAVSGGRAWDYSPTRGPSRRRPTGALPVVAVPTTSGSGSHADATAVLTNPETREKAGMWFPVSYPKLALVDPELIVSSPPAVTRASGLDVLFQCVEPLVGRRASPFTAALAEEGLRLVRRFLVRAFRKGDDLEARTGMAIADTMAGIAIDQGGVGLIHALEHPVSGRFDVAHGDGLAAIAPAVFEFNGPARPVEFARIAALLRGMEPAPGAVTTGQPGHDAARALAELYQELDVRPALGGFGVTEADVPALVADARATGKGAVANNPREATDEDMARLLREAL